MKVLIVDDEQANRLILQAMLKKGNHEVIEACDGKQAVELFDENRPDLVLMDVMMPVMDGYEATQIIKEKSSTEFVPVIFLTAITDEDALVKCIESGGDDFLTKPYNRTILQAKIAAMERIRLLNHTVSLQNKELAEYHAYIEREQEVAEKIFSKLMQQGETNLPMVHTYRESAATFNGDIFLISRQPSGVVYLMVGDFTGHGLAAALGALPATQIFYAMCNKGFSVEEIVDEINDRLKNLLPTGIFLAASIIQLDPRLCRASIWHGGLPDLFKFNCSGRVIEKIPSTHMPLGVLASDNINHGIEQYHLDKGDVLLIYSDGLIETFNSEGEIYGEDRLEDLIQNLPENCENNISEIVRDLNSFRQGSESHDDVTLVEFVCNDDFFEPGDSLYETDLQPKPKEWNLAFSFEHDILKNYDPIPSLMNVLRDIQGLQKYKEDIFLILSELFTNALDYGVLQMDSSIKMHEDGFDKYYKERNKRLSELEEGWIKIEISDRKNGEEGCLTICVEDSGKGFIRKEESDNEKKENLRHGRGLPLIESIATSLNYNKEGNRVEVLYEWR
ncbi:MAG: fused response regulator/phosphatase [Gammaproteobacteria bacterium]|nr:fused response regulator/phosphatase [Gammaproteobacteria bacterium]